MKKLFLALMAISLLAYPVMAEEMVCPDGHVCPEPCPESIAEMTPHCPLMNGKMFGECVSKMATP